MADIATLGLRVDANELDAAGRKLRDFERQGAQTEKAVERSAGNMRIAFAATAAAVTATYVAITKLAERGGQIANVMAAFERVAGNSAVALEQLRAASRGLITDYDLMVQMNRAVTLGAAQNVKDFAHVLEDPEMAGAGDEGGTAIWKFLSQIAAT